MEKRRPFLHAIETTSGAHLELDSTAVWSDPKEVPEVDVRNVVHPQRLIESLTVAEVCAILIASAAADSPPPGQMEKAWLALAATIAPKRGAK